jgi:hypothetical protein
LWTSAHDFSNTAQSIGVFSVPLLLVDPACAGRPCGKIDCEEIIEPAGRIPRGSRFKGYRDFVVQDLMIGSRNTRYRLARWQTPDGKTLTVQLPRAVAGSHFGATLVSYVLYQHHHCHVTQPLLCEQLREWGIEISSGQLNALLQDFEPVLWNQAKCSLPIWVT